MQDTGEQRGEDGGAHAGGAGADRATNAGTATADPAQRQRRRTHSHSYTHAHAPHTYHSLPPMRRELAAKPLPAPLVLSQGQPYLVPAPAPAFALPTLLSANPASNSTNLYLRGLSLETTDEDLIELCKRYGPISSAKSIIDRETGKCKGFGFVMFETPEVAYNALVDLQQKGYHITYAKLAFSEKNNTPEEDPTNLYFSNLPPTYTEEDLQTLLQPHGEVISCRILRDSDSGDSRGVGFARMHTREICEAAIKALNGLVLTKTDGSPTEPVICKFADTPRKKVPRGTSPSTLAAPWTYLGAPLSPTPASAAPASTVHAHPQHHTLPSTSSTPSTSSPPPSHILPNVLTVMPQHDHELDVSMMSGYAPLSPSQVASHPHYIAIPQQNNGMYVSYGYSNGTYVLAAPPPGTAYMTNPGAPPGPPASHHHHHQHQHHQHHPHVSAQQYHQPPAHHTHQPHHHHASYPHHNNHYNGRQYSHHSHYAPPPPAPAANPYSPQHHSTAHHAFTYQRPVPASAPAPAPVAAPAAPKPTGAEKQQAQQGSDQSDKTEKSAPTAAPAAPSLEDTPSAKEKQEELQQQGPKQDSPHKKEE